MSNQGLALLSLFILLNIFAPAQGNLVQNGNFENPHNMDSIANGKSFHWTYLEDYSEKEKWAHIYRNQSDLFDSIQILGTGEVQPYEGTTCAGLGVYDPEFEFRDYLVGELVVSLNAGKKYKVSIAIKPGLCSGFHVSSFGIALLESKRLPPLSKRHYKALSDLIPNTQFRLLSRQSAEKWVVFESTFIAKGGEDRIILGCFEPEMVLETTRYKHINGCKNADKTVQRSGYYLIDKIVVTELL